MVAVTWTKLSDDFGDDCWSLSDAAHRLHVDGLLWSNRKLLDLRIPLDDVRRFKTPDALPELLASGYWAEDGDAYVIRHHGQYQRSREDVIKQQAANAANGRKGGRPKRSGREQAASVIRPETHSHSEPVSESRTQRDRTGQDGTELVTEPKSQGQRGEYMGGRVDYVTGLPAEPDQWLPDTDHDESGITR